MALIERLGALLLYRFLVGYLVLVAPVALFVSVTLPLQCLPWEVFALSAAFACALSLMLAITSVAYEAAVDVIDQAGLLFDQLGAPERFALPPSSCQP
jgi:hypothetical protein